MPLPLALYRALMREGAAFARRQYNQHNLNSWQLSVVVRHPQSSLFCPYLAVLIDLSLRFLCHF